MILENDVDERRGCKRCKSTLSHTFSSQYPLIDFGGAGDCVLRCLFNHANFMKSVSRSKLTFDEFKGECVEALSNRAHLRDITFKTDILAHVMEQTYNPLGMNVYHVASLMIYLGARCAVNSCTFKITLIDGSNASLKTLGDSDYDVERFPILYFCDHTHHCYLSVKQIPDG